MRKKRKRRLGSVSLPGAGAGGWKRVLILASIGFALAAWGATAKEKKSPSNTGVLAGTVFSGAGFALRGAPVLISSAGGAPTPRSKPLEWKTVTDARGEFAVRVPAGSRQYRVEVNAQGFEPQVKEAVVNENERVELNFLLGRQKP